MLTRVLLLAMALGGGCRSHPQNLPHHQSMIANIGIIDDYPAPIIRGWWPLENRAGEWPPDAPNAVANIMENYQTFAGPMAPYWHQGLDIRSDDEEDVDVLIGEDDGDDDRDDRRDTAEADADSTPMRFQENSITGNRMKHNGEKSTKKRRLRVAGRCHAPVDGRVVERAQYGPGELYWSVMVMDASGYVWQFHHLHPRTITVRIGDRVRAGDVLGRVAYWPARQNGRHYHHVHMNVARPHPSWLDADGELIEPPMPYVDGWVYYNPYDFLDHGIHYRQKIKPYSDGIMYFFKHGSSKAFAASNTSSSTATPVRVSGTVDMVLSFSSEFTPSNNVSGYPYIHGVHKLNYSIAAVQSSDDGPGRRRPDVIVHAATLLDMKRMGPDWQPCAPAYTVACGQEFLERIFRQQFEYGGRTLRSVFDYRDRKVYYSVTNAGEMGYPERERAAGSGWDTRRVPNGRYVVRVTGADWWGNHHTVSVLVNVRN